MKAAHNFPKSSYLAFGMLLAVYLPMTIFANLTYGDYLGASIINSIQTIWVQQTINYLIMLHCLTAFALMVNPINQQVEELLRVPQSFGWKRVLVRTGVMLAIVFTALSLPNFGPLLNLFGATTTLLTVMVFPVIFYLYLTASGGVYDEQAALLKKVDETSNSEVTVPEYSVPSIKQVIRYNNKVVLIAGIIVLFLGFVFCITSSAAAIVELFYTKFENPCYVQWITGHLKVEGSPTYCCGLDMKQTYANQRNCSIPEGRGFSKAFRFVDQKKE